MRTKTSFSVLFWIYAKRADLNQEAQLYARLTLNGERANLSLKRKVNVNLWDAKRQRLKGTKSFSKALNSYLEDVKADIFNLYRDLLRKENNVTAQMIKSYYLGEHKEQHSLVDIFDFHNEMFSNKLATKTLCHYRTNQKYVLRFIKRNFDQKDYPLSSLDYQFLLGFENFLRSYETDHYRGKIANNAVMKHIQRFRRQIKLAVELDWLEKDPFQKFKSKMEKREREFLSQEELKKIENFNTPIERLTTVKDLFLFSCYTGIPYADIIELRVENIFIGIDGEKWISGKRFKNGVPYKIPLLEIPLFLINKYLGHYRTKHEGTLLPRISNQRLNSYLKEIADSCGIAKNLTFHMARHTFATTVTLSNGVPIETVSKMLGHSKIATTQIYARVIEKKISHDIAELREKLSTN